MRANFNEDGEKIKPMNARNSLVTENLEGVVH